MAEVKVLYGNRFAAVVHKAEATLGQAVLVLEARFDPAREVPHGFVVVKRDSYPFPDRPYALLKWADRRHEPGDVMLFSGVYDLDHAGVVRAGAEAGQGLYLP